MVTVSPAVPATPQPPWRVRSTEYERDLAHIKHVGFLGVLHQRRLAKAEGFDDPLFVDRHGRISEGAIWNIAFWDGARVVWPEADMLRGITMQVLGEGFERLGVPQVTRPVKLDDLPSMRAAFATNSICPDQPIGSVDDHAFPGDDDLPELLVRAWQSVPAEPLE